VLRYSSLPVFFIFWPHCTAVVITNGTVLHLLLSNLMTYVVLPRSSSDGSPSISASNPRRQAATSDSSDFRSKNRRSLVRDCTHTSILFLEFPSYYQPPIYHQGFPKDVFSLGFPTQTSQPSHALTTSRERFPADHEALPL